MVSIFRSIAKLLSFVCGCPGMVVTPSGEKYNFVLLTNNRSSMPVHLTEHLAQGQHIPGIFQLNPSMSVGETIEELVLIALASLDCEYSDQISYLPLP